MDADAVDYSLSRRDVSAILFAVDREDREALLTLFEDMHPADIADLLEQIGLYDRRRLILLMTVILTVMFFRNWMTPFAKR